MHHFALIEIYPPEKNKQNKVEMSFIFINCIKLSQLHSLLPKLSRWDVCKIITFLFGTKIIMILFNSSGLSNLICNGRISFNYGKSFKAFETHAASLFL